MDFDLETGQYTLHAAQDNLTFSLHVIDDVVAEGTQSFIWTLSQAQTEYFSVDIIDNDREFECYNSIEHYCYM